MKRGRAEAIVDEVCAAVKMTGLLRTGGSDGRLRKQSGKSPAGFACQMKFSEFQGHSRPSFDSFLIYVAQRVTLRYAN